MLKESNDNNELRREEFSFDELARGVAGGTLSRGQALRYMTAALLGGLGAMAGISAAAGEADAKKKRKRKKKRPVPAVCPGRINCQAGFPGSGGSGCCSVGTVCCTASVGGGCCQSGGTCCTASEGGGCCPSGFPVCLTGGQRCQASTGGGTTARLPRL